MMVNFYSDHVQCNKSRNATIDDVVGEYRPAASLLRESTLAWYCNLRQTKIYIFLQKREIALVRFFLS